MMNYTTESGFPDLDGDMDVINGKVTRYHSSLRGNGMLLGSKLVTNFLVKLTGVPKPYHIISEANGSNKYEGNADNGENGKRKLGTETWVATATIKKPKKKPTAKAAAASKARPRSVGKTSSARPTAKSKPKSASSAAKARKPARSEE